MKKTILSAAAVVAVLALAGCAPAASEQTAAPKVTETTAPAPEVTETAEPAPEYPEVDLPACWDLPVPEYTLTMANDPTGDPAHADSGLLCSIGSHAGGDTAAANAWADAMVASGWNEVEANMGDVQEARSVVAPDQSVYVMYIAFPDGNIIFFKEKGL